MSEMPLTTRKYLDAWFSQRPTCALMGEYSAGKSTLLNLLLGGEVLLTQVTATNMPVVWMTYGETAQGHSLSRDGTLNPFDLDDLRDDTLKDKLLLRLEMPAEILKRMDVIDTPGISDPRLALGALEFLGPYLDFVIWCSAANQAWRQTERAMWTSMPKSLRAQSLMALTRADTMRNAKDLKKVVSRCEKEAQDLFRAFSPIATMMALGARDADGAVTDQDAWEKSHAKDFFDALEPSIEAATIACESRETMTPPVATKVEATPKKVARSKQEPAKEAKLETILADAPAPTKVETPKKAEDKAENGQIEEAETTLETVSRSATDGIPAAISTVSELSAAIYAMRLTVDTTPINKPVLDTLDHLFTTFLCETNLSDAHQTVLGRAMSLEGSQGLSHNEVILQLVQEIEDFAEAPWCRLDQIH